MSLIPAPLLKVIEAVPAELISPLVDVVRGIVTRDVKATDRAVVKAHQVAARLAAQAAIEKRSKR